MAANGLFKTSTPATNAPKRRTGLVLTVVVLVAIVAAGLVFVRAPISADAASELSALPPTGADKPADAPPSLDHSVVKSKSVTDEPDLTGASIGTFGP